MFLPFGFPNQNPVHKFDFSFPYYMPCPPHAPTWLWSLYSYIFTGSIWFSKYWEVVFKDINRRILVTSTQCVFWEPRIEISHRRTLDYLSTNLRAASLIFLNHFSLWTRSRFEALNSCSFGNTFIPGRSTDATLFFLLISTSELQIYLLAYLHWQWGSWVCGGHSYGVTPFIFLSINISGTDRSLLSLPNTSSFWTLPLTEPRIPSALPYKEQW
jgi:hypothetical protein